MRPILRKLDRISLGSAFVQMIAPMGLIFLNTFLAVFEGIFNCYAELTRFGDREFYQDFWNSTNFDDWSRKWNIVVHNFLKRYLYTYAIEVYKVGIRV
ncbi:MAG: MBOAT family O-acyltransferase [Candidatus Pacebacteria bacterium]|nr:MBOAT family O-acyltransferase [Candidatus Paceibacterota bacterium]